MEKSGADPFVKVTPSSPDTDEKIISVRLTSRMESALKPEEIAKHVSNRVAEELMETVGKEVYAYLKTHRGDLVDRVVEKVAFALSTRLLESMGPTGQK